MTTTVPQITGPAGLPLVGSMLDLKRDPLGTFLGAHREHGDLVRITAGPPGLRTELYGVFSAEGAQQVLATDSANFRKDNAFYQEVRDSFGNGLLTSQDEAYLRQRRLVQPLFTRRRVDGYAQAITAETDATLQGWPDVPGGVVDVSADMMRLALRTVARILFGTDVESAVGVVERCFPVIGEYVLRRAFSPASAPRHWPTPANRRAAAAMAELYAECDGIIGRRRGGGSDGAAPAGEDLLGLLARTVSDGDSALDAGEIRDQVLIFLLAGHETTATSLAFALHLLARHPDEQRRARDEAARVLGGRTPVAADLDALPYLTRVLKEAMRLFPAAPVIGRRAVAAAEVSGGVIPAGADVIVAPWVTHRHTRYWDDPQRFDPDRFTPEREKERPRYAWFPFGGGPRACIGQHFSMLESVLALAVILQRYELEAVDLDVPVSAGITLRAEGPVRCRLRPVPSAS
ncbi:cytochrome P450 [Streptomyces sp. MUM 203J]|uniref:cytochrome P450 n=1 Tax=Streptomyces sp. MUM 203J TaxID=2791990 RepID=UPI001F035FF1|nr:cytochrome P450 [Streptomyces sp. MUM 203J]MCH0540788.1 cytochrome P450 [Streptomyces sp. MUM 203J]